MEGPVTDTPAIVMNTIACGDVGRRAITQMADAMDAARPQLPERRLVASDDAPARAMESANNTHAPVFQTLIALLCVFIDIATIIGPSR